MKDYNISTSYYPSPLCKRQIIFTAYRSHSRNRRKQSTNSTTKEEDDTDTEEEDS